ncbi:MAG: hypothetical protein DRJ42_20430 [Deltaproteobacteria bacterium]|nr:MAG: hypothetical protein DRJ42_20430 [Deltaproteobacteria bacterium]
MDEQRPRELGTPASVAAYLAGSGVCLLAAGIAFLLMAHHTSAAEAAVGAAATMVVVPLALTLVFVRAFRKLEPTASYLGNAGGVFVAWAVLVLLVVGLGLRPHLGQALGAACERHGLQAATLCGAAEAAAGWLAAPPAPVSAPARPEAPADSGTADSDTGPEAHRLPPSTPETPEIPDSQDIPEPSEPVPGTNGEEPAVPEQPPRVPRNGGALVSLCNLTISASALPIDDESPAHLLVVCYDEPAVVLAVENNRLQVVHTITAAPLEGRLVYLDDATVTDIDGDGYADMVLGTRATSPAGGARPGGGVYLVRRGTLGRVDTPVLLVAVNSHDLAVGDVTGDGAPELVVLDFGNTYNPAENRGSLHWFGQRGRHWRRRGRLYVAREPEHLWLRDVDDDGVLDALVAYGAGQDPFIYPGSPEGPQATEPPRSMSVPEPAEAALRLDADTVPDYAYVDDYKLYVQTSQMPGRPGQRPARSEDCADLVLSR